MEDLLVEGVDLDENQARFTLCDLPDRPGLVAEVFDRVAEGRVVVDMIVQSVGRDNLANVTFTVAREEAEAVAKITEELAGVYGCRVESHVAAAKLTVRGTGLRSHTGLAYRMFKTLADDGVNVDVISMSERSVGVVVDASVGQRGRDELAKEFAEETL